MSHKNTGTMFFTTINADNEDRSIAVTLFVHQRAVIYRKRMMHHDVLPCLCKSLHIPTNEHLSLCDCMSLFMKRQSFRGWGTYRRPASTTATPRLTCFILGSREKPLGPEQTARCLTICLQASVFPEPLSPLWTDRLADGKGPQDLCCRSCTPPPPMTFSLEGSCLLHRVA